MPTAKELQTVSGNVRSTLEARISGQWRTASARALLGAALVPACRASGSSCTRTTSTPSALNRGGIDERWFASTTPAANENRTPDEGLSYVVARRQAASRSRDAVAGGGRELIGDAIWNKYKTLAGLLASSSTTWARSRTTCTRATSRPRWSARKASPRATTSRRSSTTSATTSPTPSWAWSPARPRTQVRKCLENWNKGDNGILDLSQGLPPEARHRLADSARACCTRPARSAPTSRSGAPTCSACTSRWSKAATCRGRCSSRTCPRRSTRTSTSSSSSSTGRRTSIRTSRTTTTSSRSPVGDTASEGYVDNWIVYGKVDGEQLFTAKELTVDARPEGHDQGQRRLRPHLRPGRRPDQQAPAEQPEVIRFHELTEDEVFVHRRRRQGRRDVREHQRHRAAGRLALLRPGGQPGCAGDEVQGKREAIGFRIRLILGPPRLG